MGQLGLGEDVLERKRPAMVTLPEGIVQAVAGGMHTVCLSDTGNVWFLNCSHHHDLSLFSSRPCLTFWFLLLSADLHIWL